MDRDNTLSAVADNDTKGVADGIENTMGRGLERVFRIGGTKSEMFPRYMTFTSCSYKKVGNDWVRDSHAPVPKLVIENELPNWQTPVIPSTGTVNQEDLLAMADSSTREGAMMLKSKEKRQIIHQILTRHNYMSVADFTVRMREFNQRANGSLEDKSRLADLPEYKLSALDFGQLPAALAKLIRNEKITIK